MKLRWVLMALWLTLPGAAAGAQGEPRALIRSHLLDGEQVLVSQPSRLAVDVLVPTYFSGSPRFPDEIELEDAFTMLLPGWSVNLTERIGGKTWSGIRRTYTVFGLQPGLIAVPSVEVAVRWANESGRPGEWQTLRSAPLELRASLPSGAGAIKPFLAAHELRLLETLQPDPQQLKVGDALTRTITMEMEGTPSFFLPELEFDEIAGLGVYPAAGRSRDSGGERGSPRIGRRVQSVTYALEGAGSFTLPAIEVAWWSLADGAVRTARLEAVTLSVAANSGLDEEQTDHFVEAVGAEEVEEEASWIGRLLAVLPVALVTLVVVLVVSRLLLKAWPLLRTRHAARRRRRADSEFSRFAAFARAARSGDGAATYLTGMSWLAALTGSTSVSLREFVEATGDSQLQAEIDGLLASLWGRDGGQWSPAGLVDAMSRARQDFRIRSTQGSRDLALPGLNPSRRVGGS